MSALMDGILMPPLAAAVADFLQSPSSQAVADFLQSPSSRAVVGFLQSPTVLKLHQCVNDLEGPAYRFNLEG